ncbi:acyl-CoA dehydrogenase family protein [Mesorhizobium sp. DCY119]|uniref:acyl-CoA dehydrogenase family protein n=1 Tax=Mesorhizobium sp. DCY119 TaxID=2108445 RepID=UPI000E7142F9|nr:acyl-CoA dehydrogenase family protein [Mesorhizobium sp. DCY119]RJG40449.1 SfnB family sulfur acquisition oxidoreductase [Mesorhizobium sp. DCY119]
MSAQTAQRRQSEPAAALLSSPDEAIDAAQRLAASWNRTAADIDTTRRIPVAELAELGRSGLLAISVPKSHGGPDLGVETLMRVFLILAQTDTALAQIPQNHFDFVDTLNYAEPETAAYLYGELMAGARFGNAIAEPGRKSRADLATTIVEDGDDYLINGKKFFCTGALTADWVPVHAKHADGRIRTAYLPRDANGLDMQADWDAFGQRATFSGTTIIDNVRVPRPFVIDRTLGHPGLLAAQFAGNQLIHAAIEAGSALSAVRIAGEVAARTSLGISLTELTVRAEAARALVLRSARKIDAALADPDDRVAVITAMIGTDQAKSLAYELAPAAANELSYAIPADEPEAAELERLWRNVRTHTLHDPVRWRQHFVGDFHLNNRLAADVATRFGFNPANNS